MNSVTIKNNLILIGLALLLLSCSGSQKLFQENSKEWDVFGDAKWNYSKHELIGKASNEAGFVLTKQSYKNFELQLEFKPDSTINSGVFIHCQTKDINPTACYEINIWDLHPDQTNRTGAIVGRAVPITVVETINKWNTYRIKVENNHIQVWINEILTVDTTNDELPEGYIGLQAKGTGEVSFRNIKIKSLKED